MKLTLKQKFILLKACLKTIRNPMDQSAYQQVMDQVAGLDFMTDLIVKLNQDRASRNAIENLSTMKPLTLGELDSYPPRTLGFAVSQFLSINLIEPRFQSLESTDQISYIQYRFKEYHQVWKVILGVENTIEGEVELQSFLYAQTHSPVSMIYVTLSLIHTLIFKPMNLLAVTEAISEGYQRGLRARVIWGVAFENYYGENLAALRQKCLHPSLQVVPQRPTYDLAH